MLHLEDAGGIERGHLGGLGQRRPCLQDHGPDGLIHGQGAASEGVGQTIGGGAIGQVRPALADADGLAQTDRGHRACRRHGWRR